MGILIKGCKAHLLFSLTYVGSQLGFSVFCDPRQRQKVCRKRQGTVTTQLAIRLTATTVNMWTQLAALRSETATGVACLGQLIVDNLPRRLGFCQRLMYQPQFQGVQSHAELRNKSRKESFINLVLPVLSSYLLVYLNLVWQNTPASTRGEAKE